MAAVAPLEKKLPGIRSIGRAAVAVVAIGGVVALGVLIVRELMPHHTAVRASAPAVAPPVEVTAAVAPASTAPAEEHHHRGRAAGSSGGQAESVAPASTAPAPAPGRIPLAANLISQVVVSPEAFAPSSVFAPPVAKTEMFHFEQLPPFNSTDLKRSRANPKSWELDAMHGPKMDDLGPAGAVREAAVVKDDIGNSTSWYAIESGPLAPAFAVNGIMGIRVMSRAFVEDHRADFPAPVASLLDR